MVWMARHDNGWFTFVIPAPDGTFHAFALAPGESPTTPAYVEMDEPSAKAAALYALAGRTGHRVCSGRCTGWESHLHDAGRD